MCAYPGFKNNNGWRYEYDPSLRLYTKESMSTYNISKLHLTEVQLRTEDVFEAVDLVTRDPDIQKFHENSLKVPKKPAIPFHIGFQTADSICFTRESTDEVGILTESDYF